MDPESLAFQPRDDFWRFQSEMLRVQQNQAELSERVSRLERKNEEDSRLKNVWGSSSPFSSALGGTPQQVPMQQPTAEQFPHFDDQSNNLIGNLQLDADEEPRRVGATSRANSVRFDETANPGHWAHASRSSLDLITRTSSSMGGHVMSERSYSHKSDGRQSSAGHSVHSATSGRANSLSSFGLVTSIGPPELAPGLFVLGPVPAIIRCWLNTDFKHDSLLYAAVCSGTYTSCLDLHIIERLGFQSQIFSNEEGARKIKLSVYLPEAVPVSTSLRSSSPAPHLPSIGVDFTVIEEHNADTNPKAIQIFLGSDMLRAHNADLLFSSNQLIIYDDERNKLQVPLVRPEDDRAFKSLSVACSVRTSTESQSKTDTLPMSSQLDVTNECFRDISCEPELPTAVLNNVGTAVGCDAENSSDRPDVTQRSYLDLSNGSRSAIKDAPSVSTMDEALDSGAPSAIWSNWRRDQGEKGNQGSLDWANVSRNTSSNLSYQRRDTGIKVLKPSKPIKSMQTSISSPVTGQPRFFDDGKQPSEGDMKAHVLGHGTKKTVLQEKAKDSAPALAKTRSVNPAGGASAFAWLNSGRSK